MGTSESEMYWYSSILILLLLLHSKSINLYWYSLNLTNFQYKSDKITCQISKIYYQIIYWCCSLFDNLKSLSFMKLLEFQVADAPEILGPAGSFWLLVLKDQYLNLNFCIAMKLYSCLDSSDFRIKKLLLYLCVWKLLLCCLGTLYVTVQVYTCHWTFIALCCSLGICTRSVPEQSYRVFQDNNAIISKDKMISILLLILLIPVVCPLWQNMINLSNRRQMTII